MVADDRIKHDREAGTAILILVTTAIVVHVARATIVGVADIKTVATSCCG